MDELTSSFLEEFKKLEDKIEIIAPADNGFPSFSRALDRAHKEHLNPVVSSEEAYQFLKTASDLRNLLSHEDNVCIPSAKFVERFRSYAEEIIHPLTAYDIATKEDSFVEFGPRTKVKDAVRIMVERHLSHVPVVMDRTVRGVFSVSSFFQAYYEKRSLKVDDETLVGDLIELKCFQEHMNEEYLFVAKNQPAYSLIRKFAKDRSGSKRVSCLFVTASGNMNEPLCGIITETDLLRLPAYQRKMQS